MASDAKDAFDETKTIDKQGAIAASESASTTADLSDHEKLEILMNIEIDKLYDSNLSLQGLLVMEDKILEKYQNIMQNETSKSQHLEKNWIKSMTIISEKQLELQFENDKNSNVYVKLTPKEISNSNKKKKLVKPKKHYSKPSRRIGARMITLNSGRDLWKPHKPVKLILFFFIFVVYYIICILYAYCYIGCNFK